MLDVTAKQGISARIRLVIGDRQPIVLQGLRSVLGAQHDFDVVASSSDGTSCLEAIRNLAPDIALLADTLPDLTATEILAIAKAENLATRLVFFTESESDRGLTAAIAAGICCAISKYASPDSMLRSLRLMMKRSVSPEQFELSPTGNDADGGSKIEKMLELLTQRERQIVRLVSEGMSNKEIARQLDVSPGTVKVHLYNIFQKLEITNRTVLATLALLQRPSGFGTLALAFLAIAIADELKASEANDMLPNDDGIGHAGEHAEYEPWKKAILRHLVVWESSEPPPLIQREFSAKLSRVTSPAAATEALHAAEQSAGAKAWKDHGPAGSSASNLAPLSLRGMNGIQIGGDPTPEHQIPRPASNPTSVHGEYGTFAALAGALIYALHDPHLAAAQTHDAAHASIDSFQAVTGENATTKVAAINNADAHHVDNSVAGFPSHEAHLPSAFLTTGNDGVAGEGARSQMSDDAAGDNLQKTSGLVELGHDASLGRDGRDQLTGGNVEKVVHRSSTDSSATSSDVVFDFASGPSRINLAAFGALAWLHMTAASKSIPPHTLAWIYDSASNETIVYVNPTDHVLDVGDRSLLEIHLQGIVSIADADPVHQPEGTAVAITLEELEGALISVAATDETVQSADNVHGIVGEDTAGADGVWNRLADDGLRFHFGQTRAGSGASTKFRTVTADSAAATEERDGASHVSVRGSSIEPAHSAMAAAAGNLTFKSEPEKADTGILSPVPNEVVGPSVAAAADADRGNSQHASEPESAKPAATESAEADSKPGKGDGNEAEHHASASKATPGSAKKAQPGGAEHGNSGHDSRSAAASAPEASEIVEPGVAMADTKGRGNSEHASEPGSAQAATGLTEKGNGVGNGAEHHAPASDASRGSAKTAEQGGVAHGHSGHDSHSPAANASEAAEIVGPSVATAEKAGHSNAHHAEPGSAKAAATDMGEARSAPGSGAGNDNGHHSSASDGSRGAAKTAEPSGVEHGNSGHDPHPSPANAPEAAETAEPSVATTDGAGRGNSQHSSEPGSAKLAATESTEAGFTPGNGAEHHAPASDAASASAAVATAEPAAAAHGSSGHSTAANTPEAGEIAAPSVAAGGDAGGGNAQQAAQSAASEAAQPAKAASKIGGADQELVFRFDGETAPSTSVAAVELKRVHDPLDPHVPLGQEGDLEMIVKMAPQAPVEHTADHGTNGPHHGIVPAPHDLLI